MLDDTDLSVTEVAFAAAFGSLRQFNRACRDLFRDSPRGLRAGRRKTDRLVGDGGCRCGSLASSRLHRRQRTSA
jgi:AraC family transcriptional regulator of adaptative response / DNA-3-methyladenine glycosylase II